MTRRPWFKFYTSDWRADPGLRSCSLAARGLWIDLLTIMHEATPYGHLLISGKRPSYYRISQIVGVDVRVVRNLMAELEKACVYTCTSTGEVTSRRMLRDELKRQQTQELKNYSSTKNKIAPYHPETRKKERGSTKESKRKKYPANKMAFRRARHHWENDLLREYGPDAYARAVDMLAAHPVLVSRATNAELREPGSGVMAAMLGLRQHMVTP